MKKAVKRPSVSCCGRLCESQRTRLSDTYACFEAQDEMGHRSRNHSEAVTPPAEEGGMSPLGADRRPPPDQPERFLGLQHRIDGLQQCPSHRHPPHIAAMLLRHAIVERPKLRGTIDRMHRDFDQDPAQPRGALFREASQSGGIRRGMHRGHQARVRAQVPTVGKPTDITNLAVDQRAE